LKNHVAVVTDNDGDYQKHVIERYTPYSGVTTIKVCADNDNAASTLELQILKHNSWAAMNGILGTSYTTGDELKKYLLNNKTDWALKLLDSSATIIYPQYILDAVG
jgi:putative ATP-dependent endonuclease of OLD family